MKDMIRFALAQGLPTDERVVRTVLRSSGVKRVTHFCLGPEGTNIGLAAETWTKQAGLCHKS